MTDRLTLMAVHAHPDDESSSTGGVLATYSDEGIRTVVVTCTNGEFGDAPGGVKPGEEGHQAQDVAQLRLAELRKACELLGVTDLETLGYHDSGMPDWEYRTSPEAVGSMLVAAPSGERIPLSRLADVEVVEGPSTITREWGQRRSSPGL